jgi:hypothetical protein
MKSAGNGKADGFSACFAVINPSCYPDKARTPGSTPFFPFPRAREKLTAKALTPKRCRRILESVLETRNCHPKKSLYEVEAILSEMKAGKRENAEFWLNGASIMRSVSPTCFPPASSRVSTRTP